KLYVDLSLKQSLSVTVAAFETLPRNASDSVSVVELNAFVEEYLGGAQEGLVQVDPVDFVPIPEDLLPGVKSPKARDWVLEVHGIAS
ncbi:hypothetical protein PSY31_23225, partial [Shigella flexneri]|nr:hypothetical protein [Shigella flexneri]